jgi:aspartate aminotransferase
MKLSERLNTIEESATLALNTKAKELAASGRKIYNFTAGEPSTDTPEYIKDYVAGKLNENHYTPVAGLPELREAIARHAKEFYSATWVKKENVLVVAGGKPGLYLSLLSTLNPGDEVILPTPAWVSYKYIIELAGATVVETRLGDNFDLDIDNIGSAITDRTKVIIINSPNNPTGSIYSPASLEKLAELLANTGITVLADDMYTKLVFDESFEPVTKFGFKNLIISSGFSKSQALTGWRVGYLIAEPDLIKAAAKLQSHLLGNTAVLSQYGALAGLEHNDEPPMYDELRANRDIVVEKLGGIDVIKLTPPAGAFYAFIDIHSITEDSLNWCEKLLDEKGVALVPGEAFFAPGYVRLSFTTGKEVLIEGLLKIKEFIGESS